MNPQMFQERISLASWVFIPVVAVWFTTGYLVSMNRQPVWISADKVSVANNEPQVLGDSSLAVPTPNIQKIKSYPYGLVTLWFDDAWESQYTYALPKMEEQGMVGAVSVPTNMINFPDYMSWYQLKLLQYQGWEIASHTRNHTCNINDITPQYIEDELKGSLQDLTDHGLRVKNFVTPCGVDNQATLYEAKNYYMSLRTTKDGLNSLPVPDPYDLKVEGVGRTTTAENVQIWIDEAKTNRSWLILMFHQIDNKPENIWGTDKETFSKIIDLIKNSGMEVVTPTQALQLVTQ